MSKPTELVTVVIPTFNRKDQLRKAVSSALAQLPAGMLRVEIFDNASTDGTEELVAELMKEFGNIGYTRRKENIGGMRNYAEATGAVQTRYFVPLADDDWLLDGGIGKLLTVMERSPDLGVAVAQTVHADVEGKEIKVTPSAPWIFRRYEAEEFFPLWCERGHFEWSSILFRTEAVQAVGGLDWEIGAPGDVDLQLRLFLRYPVELVEHRSAVFLAHPGQLSRVMDRSRRDGLCFMLGRLQAAAATNPQAGFIESGRKEFSVFWVTELAFDVGDHGTLGDFGLTAQALWRSTRNLPLLARFGYRWSRRVLRNWQRSGRISPSGGN